MTVRPRANTLRRISGFALVMLVLFLVLTLRGQVRATQKDLNTALEQNTTLIEQNEEALEQNKTLIRSNDRLEREIGKTNNRLAVQGEQIAILIKQLRAAGIEPLVLPKGFEDRGDVSQPKASPREDATANRAPPEDSQRQEPREQQPRKDPPPPSKKDPTPPKEPNPPPPTEEPNPVERAVKDVEKAVCGLLGC